MEHVGYGVCIKKHPHGIWPVGLVRAQDVARRIIDEGIGNGTPKQRIEREDVSIVPVYVGNPIDLAPPPVFSEPPEKVTA